MVVHVLRVAGVVSAYWAVSITLVFANKHLLGEQDARHGISLFVTWIQCLLAVTILGMQYMMRGLLNGDWAVVDVTSGGGGLVMMPVLAMTCTSISMLTFNNMCLEYVSMAFYQVARSLTIVFVVILSIVILKKTVSMWVITCCLFVGSGFILGVDQESITGSLNTLGIAFGIITSFFIALQAIFTKRAMEALNGDSLKLTLYINLNSSIIMFPIVLVTGQFQRFLSTAEFQTAPFVWCLLVTGVLGILIGWLSAVQIDITSPLTHNISANAKAVCQTMLAVLYYGETKPPLWWLSIAMVGGGAVAYAAVRVWEERTINAQHQTDVQSDSQSNRDMDASSK